MSDGRKNTKKRQATESTAPARGKKRRQRRKSSASEKEEEEKATSSATTASLRHRPSTKRRRATAKNDQDKKYVDLWQKVNDQLSSCPRFQNTNPGVSDDDIHKFEQRYRIQLPDDVKRAIRVHNGREKLDYGLGWRLASTDLLPLDKWTPFEERDWASDLFEELDDDGACAVKSLQDDAQAHLAAYRKNKDLVENNEFQKLPTELIVIGEGMDDYCEEYLLSLRSGRIYLQILNIPEWKLHAKSMAEWLELSAKSANDSLDDIEEIHDGD